MATLPATHINTSTYLRKIQPDDGITRDWIISDNGKRKGNYKRRSLDTQYDDGIQTDSRRTQKPRYSESSQSACSQDADSQNINSNCTTTSPLRGNGKCGTSGTEREISNKEVPQRNTTTITLTNDGASTSSAEPRPLPPPASPPVSSSQLLPKFIVAYTAGFNSTFELIEALKKEHPTWDFTFAPAHEAGHYVIKPSDEATAQQLQYAKIKGRNVHLVRVDPYDKNHNLVVQNFPKSLDTAVLYNAREVCEAKRLLRGFGKHKTPSKSVLIKWNGTHPPDKITIPEHGTWMLRTYIPTYPRCRRCQQWGHSKTQCTNNGKCGVCSGVHETEVCIARFKKTGEKGTPKCPNCSANHHAWNPTCPIARLFRKRAQDKASKQPFFIPAPHHPSAWSKPPNLVAQKKPRRQAIPALPTHTSSSKSPTPTHQIGLTPNTLIDIIGTTIVEVAKRWGLARNSLEEEIKFVTDVVHSALEKNKSQEHPTVSHGEKSVQTYTKMVDTTTQTQTSSAKIYITPQTQTCATMRDTTTQTQTYVTETDIIAQTQKPARKSTTHKTKPTIHKAKCTTPKTSCTTLKTKSLKTKSKTPKAKYTTPRTKAHATSIAPTTTTLQTSTSPTTTSTALTPKRTPTTSPKTAPSSPETTISHTEKQQAIKTSSRSDTSTLQKDVIFHQSPHYKTRSTRHKQCTGNKVTSLATSPARNTDNCHKLSSPSLITQQSAGYDSRSDRHPDSEEELEDTNRVLDL